MIKLDTNLDSDEAVVIDDLDESYNLVKTLNIEFANSSRKSDNNEANIVVCPMAVHKKVKKRGVFLCQKRYNYIVTQIKILKDGLCAPEINILNWSIFQK